MPALVDATVLSAAFRRPFAPRSGTPQAASVLAFRQLAGAGEAAVLGASKQEVLSGVADGATFRRLVDALRTFAEVPVLPSDYEQAAECFNVCRARGVQGSAIDFLMCAVSKRLNYPILTTDRDFERYATILGTALYPVASQ